MLHVVEMRGLVAFLGTGQHHPAGEIADVSGILRKTRLTLGVEFDRPTGLGKRTVPVGDIPPRQDMKPRVVGDQPYPQRRESGIGGAVGPERQREQLADRRRVAAEQHLKQRLAVEIVTHHHRRFGAVQFWLDRAGLVGQKKLVLPMVAPGLDDDCKVMTRAGWFPRRRGRRGQLPGGPIGDVRVKQVTITQIFDQVQRWVVQIGITLRWFFPLVEAVILIQFHGEVLITEFDGQGILGDSTDIEDTQLQLSKFSLAQQKGQLVGLDVLGSQKVIADEQDRELRLGQCPLNLRMKLVADVDSLLIEPKPIPDGGHGFQRRHQFIAVLLVLVAEADEDFAVHGRVL